MPTNLNDRPPGGGEGVGEGVGGGVGGGEGGGEGGDGGRNCPRVQLPFTTLHVLRRVHNGVWVPLCTSRSQLEQLCSLEQRVQHSAVVLQGNDGTILPVSPAQHIPTVVLAVSPHVPLLMR